MMPSITNLKGNRIKLWAVLFWLLLWQMASMALGQEILLASPVSVFLRLKVLVFFKEFWSTIGTSFAHIAGGFFLAVIVGILLAAFSHRYTFVKEMLKPLLLTIRSVPVVSFIILILIWVTSEKLAIVISFLMVLPIIYGNVLGGLDYRSKQLAEMAQVFKIPLAKRIRYIDIPQIMPFFKTGCHVALGLSWKAGIAAEVIGVSSKTIGEQLYFSKIYLDTPSLLAWTVVIVLLSLIFEKLFMTALTLGEKSLERM